MIASAAMMYPTHLIALALGAPRTLIPFATLPLFDFLIQIANGAFSLGGVYLLFNEASRWLQPAKNLGSLLLAIGMSFSVPMTLLFESFLYNIPFQLTQCLGVILFMLGFAAVRSPLLKLSD